MGGKKPFRQPLENFSKIRGERNGFLQMRKLRQLGHRGHVSLLQRVGGVGRALGLWIPPSGSKVAVSTATLGGGCEPQEKGLGFQTNTRLETCPLKKTKPLMTNLYELK